MTLGVTPPLIDYLENGVTVLHAVPFQFQTGLEIDCSRIVGGVETALVLGGDFTVAGGGGGTGTVTKSFPGVVGATFRIRRVTTRGQETDLLAHDPFPPDDVELSLDRVAAVNQEQEVEVTLLEGRTIHVPPGDTIATLPGPPLARANLYMKFYNDGREIQLLSVNAVAADLAIPLAPLLGTVTKGDPGSAGEGYPTRAAMALAGNAASNRDDAYLCETGREGKFVFIVPLPGQEAAFAALVTADPQQGVYVARQGDATGVTGAWVRKWDGATLNVRWFGAVLDNFTIDYVAIQAAVNLSYATRLIPTVGIGILPGFNPGGGVDVLIPSGIGFMGVNTLTLAHNFNLRGNNLGVPAGQSSGMRWPQDVTGILNAGRAGIFGMALFGAFGLTTTTEGEYHAIKATFTFPYGDLSIWNWQGDGINLDCTGGTNVNGVVGQRVWCNNCRNGYWNKAGSDNSAGMHMAWNIDTCREWGIKEETFLAVGHYSHEVAACGTTKYNDGVTIGCSVVSQGGNRYCAIIGQEVWCRTHPPTGTTLDNQGWAYFSPGGASPLQGIVAWFNNILVRAGGSYTAQNPNGPSGFVNCYHETGQGLAQLNGSSSCFGGNLPQSIWKGNASVTPAPGLLGNFAGLIVGPPVVVNRAYTGTDEDLVVTLGFRESQKSFGTLTGSVTSPLTWRMFKVLGNDLLLAEYGGGGIYQQIVLTGPGTSFQGGSGAAQPGALVCSNVNFYTGNSSGNARRVTTWPGAPTAFSWGKTDVAFDLAVAPGGKVGNVCTTAGIAGSTAVFKPFGPVDA